MFKNLISIAVLLFVSLAPGLCQNDSRLLAQADSLFSLQHYTQSFDLYDSLFQTDREASNSMLLKMAFIKEGLGDITSAQYYLNEYYLATSNDQALDKMKQLAEANSLEGYDHSDATYLFTLYHKYYSQIILSVIGILVIMLVVLVVQKRKFKVTPYGSLVIILILLAGLFYLINYGSQYEKGLVISDHTFVMTAPSSGSEILDVIKQGHKVDVAGQTDVWLAIKWNNQRAYVKSRNILRINNW